MNLTEIVAEVKARGFDYVPDPRVERWVNLAYQRICEREAWPFLEETTTGNAPLIISDLRAVLSVVSVTSRTPVTWEDYRTLRERDPNLEATGTPESWYALGQTLHTYPASTDELSVHYLRVPPVLVGSDAPLIPARFHYALVDWAVSEALKDTDNFESFNAMAPIIEGTIQEMGDSLLVTNYDSAASIAPTGRSASVDW